MDKIEYGRRQEAGGRRWLAAGDGGSPLGATRADQRSGGRPDRADVRTLGTPGPGHENGRRHGDRNDQPAGRHQVPGRRETQALGFRCRRQRRESEECGAAHGGGFAEPGGRDRRLSQFLHAGGHRSHRTRAVAGRHVLVLGPDHLARLQVRIPDFRHRRAAGRRVASGAAWRWRKRPPASARRRSAS